MDPNQTLRNLTGGMGSKGPTPPKKSPAEQNQERLAAPEASVRFKDEPADPPAEDPAPTEGPYDPFSDLDNILAPRPLVEGADPLLYTALADCNSQAILPETPDTDDSPMDADDRTDIVWKKTILNDIAFADWILCNFAGNDMVLYAFGGNSPYIHVIVTRPLTVNQMTRLDELVSAYEDPVDYWYYFRTTQYSLHSQTADSAEELLLGTFLQPIAENEYITIIGLSFVLQYWSDSDEEFTAHARLYNWSHGSSVGEKDFTLEGGGTPHDPLYKKLMVNGLGGALNTKHEHICQIYGQTNRVGSFVKIVGMQILWGSREPVPQYL